MRKYKYLYFQIQKSQFLLLSLLKTPKVHKYLSTCYFEYMGNIFPQKYTKNRFFKLMKHPHNSHEKCQWNYIKAKRVVMERRHIFFPASFNLNHSSLSLILVDEPIQSLICQVQSSSKFVKLGFNPVIFRGHP